MQEGSAVISTFQKRFILMSTLVVGMCSLIYELLISTTSSYFLGDSITQFSIIIGIYLASMGIGSWFSRFFKKHLFFSFIVVELCLGLIGGFSVPMCYFYYTFSDVVGYQIFTYGLVGIIGMLTGMEVPLLTYILTEKQEASQDGLSDILTFDYIGALVATIVFPFILIPFMGIYKTSLLFGFLNILIGLLNLYFFRSFLKVKRHWSILVQLGYLGTILLVFLGFASSQGFMKYWNTALYKYPVIHQESSKYQNIVVTKNPNELRLYLNGAIQFSSRDEYRYHEALVHVAAQQIPRLSRVLILGGGEGLAAREVLKYPHIEQVHVVDLDKRITDMAKELPLFTEQNKHALSDLRVQVINGDAYQYVSHDTSTYDLIIADLPDPTNESLSRLYSETFYTMCLQRLSQQGLFVTQATSPELATDAFYCIEKTILASGFKHTYPYHANVPSFGNWGFIAASTTKQQFRINKYIDLDFVNDSFLQHCFFFPKDVQPTEKLQVNRLDKPILMQYYLDHWRQLQSEPR